MKNQRKLLIATRNRGKFPEIIAKLEGLPFEFLNLNDIEEIPSDYEVEEPAMTFEGNAVIKAMTLGKKTGLMVLADDSGLEVDALGGKPGVYSARYMEGSDEDRYGKLLQELADVPDNQRGAQFRCVIAVYDPVIERVRTRDGTYRGRIVREPSGSQGFGYDPVFYDEELGKTLAEMAIEEKNAVSHRGRALAKMRKALEEEFLP